MGPRPGTRGWQDSWYCLQTFATSKLSLTEPASPPRLTPRYLAFRFLRPLSSAPGPPLLGADTHEAVVALVLRVANTEAQIKRSREPPWA